jgi:hypothetical protein
MTKRSLTWLALLSGLTCLTDLILRMAKTLTSHRGKRRQPR